MDNQSNAPGDVGSIPGADTERSKLSMHHDDTAPAVPSQYSPPAKIEDLVPLHDPESIDYGDVLAKSDELREPIKFGIGAIVHELASMFANQGAAHGDTLLSVAMGYSVCVEELWKAATFLAERGVIELRDDATEKDSCQCAGCRCRRSWVQFPYDYSVDHSLIEQERDAQRQRAVRQAQQITNQTRVPVGIVYLIRCGDRYKIGITNDMNRRLDQLKGQSPYPLELVHHASGRHNSQMESRLHAEYGSFRMHGEWFELSVDQVASVIETLNEWSRGGES